jgi:hypothetical protein
MLSGLTRSRIEFGEVTDYVDLQIQFRMAKKRSNDGMQSTHDVLATIDGTGSWRAEATIDYAQLEMEQDPRKYGATLGEILFRPAVMNALRQAYGVRKRSVRIRLWLEMGPDGEREEQHGLRWERAFVVMDDKEWPLAITPELPFSRYVPVESIDSDPSDDAVFRLLVVFANPANLLSDQKPLEIEADLSKLLESMKALVQGRRLQLVILPGRTGLSGVLREKLTASQAEVLDGPATMETIATALRNCHALHIVAHGTMNPQTKRGALLLEDKDGRRAFAFDDEVYPWIHPNLRFVVLQSCQSAAPTPRDGPPFVGIGPRLVQLGVPAVIAMQDFVAMEDARVFAAAFYRSLIRSGVVDVAVNEGRQAIFQKSGNDNFSIPVLFMRLKGGQLWRPDPLRNAVLAKLTALGPPHEPLLPMRAIQSLDRSLTYNSEAVPPGALFDMPMKLTELTSEENALVLLVGSRGMGKGSQLQWLYRQAAQRFLQEDSAAPAPVALALREIVESRSVQVAIDRNLTALARIDANIPIAPPERPLLLIIDGDTEISEDSRREALQLLKSFQQSTGHRIVMTVDEGSRHTWNEDLEPTAILVARPMDFERVCQYLKRLGTSASDSLHAVFAQGRCRDVACAPWLLERMLALSQRQVTFDSRATLLRQIANESLSSTSLSGVPRSCAERALERIAWQMQWRRQSVLDSADLYEILTAVRGTREFRLRDLNDILTHSGILAPAGEDAVRFRYESLQAYYAASYLVASPNRLQLLEDITASLGRLSRVRWWETTLVTLAGLNGQSLEELLGAILSGSSLIEGEQVYLAARCHLDTFNTKRVPTQIIDQIVDALVWRSHPGNLRSYTDRKRAATTLAEMRHPNAIPHLVSLACDAIATGWGTEKRHEFSGIRLIATHGLTLMQEEAMIYVRAKRPTLVPVMNAWWTAYEEGQLDGLIKELHRNDKVTSPIAAFALGFFDQEIARQTLLEVFADDNTDRDISWAVADTFTLFDPLWVAENVLEPRLKQFVDPRIPYLIGRIGMAKEGSPQHRFLTQCFSEGIPAVQARALRARGALGDASIRTLCEAVTVEDWSAARETGMNLPKDLVEEDCNRLRNAAMEALREVGDAHSIEVLREARRAGSTMTLTLRQLSFDVSEDIYWRLHGGLSRESLNTHDT